MTMWTRKRRAALLAATFTALFVTVVAPVRAADDDDDINEGISDRIGKSIKNSMTGATKMLGLGKPAPPPPKEAPSGCPTISVLAGTESQRVMVPGATGNEGLRYQYSLLDVGRTCSISGGRVAIKVGAGGRVLLGPMGAAGRFDVPIRVAIYSELDQKVVESRLFKVPVSIAAGQAGTPFQFVSDNVVVPIAGGRTGDDYSVKVGIDGGGKAGDVAKVKRPRRGKAKAEASAAPQ